MKKLAIILAALLSLTGSRIAQAQGFTTAEKASIDVGCRLAGLSVRAALRTHESNIAVNTADDTRALFGKIEEGLDEAAEGVVSGAFYVLNAASIEPDDAQRNILRGLPRTEWMIRAEDAFDEALEELAEAKTAAVSAQALRPSDTAYQLKLTNTISAINQAVSRLNLFDRTLTYDTPPQTCLAPFSNCIQDEAAEFMAQYGYHIAEILVTSWSALPAGTNYSAYAGALSQFWLLQDSGMHVAFRAAGVVTGTVSDSMETLFGGGTSTVNQRFNGIQTNLIALRPTTGTAVDFARIDQKFSDSWRHDDRFGRAVLLAGAGI